MAGLLSRRQVLIIGGVAGVSACGHVPDVNRSPGAATGKPEPVDVETLAPTWQPVTKTGWEPEVAVWRNGARYFREITGRAAMQTSTTFLGHDRFVLTGQSQPTEAVDRAEYSALEREIYGTEKWVSYRVKVGGQNPRSWCILNQFHDVPDAGDQVVAPPFTAELVENSPAFTFKVRSATSANRNQVTENLVYEDPDFARDVWHYFIYRIVFEPGTGGSFSAWHNGSQVYAGSAPVGFNDEVGPYFKYGAYRDPAGSDLTVEYANVELSKTSLEARVVEPVQLRPVNG